MLSLSSLSLFLTRITFRSFTMWILIAEIADYVGRDGNSDIDNSRMHLADRGSLLTAERANYESPEIRTVWTADHANRGPCVVVDPRTHFCKSARALRDSEVLFVPHRYIRACSDICITDYTIIFNFCDTVLPSSANIARKTHTTKCIPHHELRSPQIIRGRSLW